MAKFIPGQSGNLNGKPKGTKDSRQFSLSFWFQIILDNYPDLNPNQRAQIALECWKKLIDKSNASVLGVNSSKLNAEQASKLLAEAEAKPLTQVNIVTKPDVNKTI